LIAAIAFAAGIVALMIGQILYSRYKQSQEQQPKDKIFQPLLRVEADR